MTGNNIIAGLTCLLCAAGCASGPDELETDRGGLGGDAQHAEDVNQDGRVDLRDAVALVDLLDGRTSVALEELELAGLAPDVDDDGSVTDRDLLWVTDRVGGTPAEAALRARGDVDGDGCVAFADYLVVSGAFGERTEEGPAGGDLDGDGEVAFADFTRLSAAFGECVELPADSGYALRSRDALMANRIHTVDQAAEALGLELPDGYDADPTAGADEVIFTEHTRPIRYPRGTVFIPEEATEALDDAMSRIRESDPVAAEMRAFEVRVEQGFFDETNPVHAALADVYLAHQTMDLTESEMRESAARRAERMNAAAARESEVRNPDDGEPPAVPTLPQPHQVNPCRPGVRPEQVRDDYTQEGRACVVSCTHVARRVHGGWFPPRGHQDQTADDPARHCVGETSATFPLTRAACTGPSEEGMSGTLRADVGALAQGDSRMASRSVDTFVECSAIERAPGACRGLSFDVDGFDAVLLDGSATANREDLPDSTGDNLSGRGRRSNANNASQASSYAYAASTAFTHGTDANGFHIRASADTSRLGDEDENVKREWCSAYVESSLGVGTGSTPVNAGIKYVSRCGVTWSLSAHHWSEAHVEMTRLWAGTCDHHSVSSSDWNDNSRPMGPPSRRDTLSYDFSLRLGRLSCAGATGALATWDNSDEFGASASATLDHATVWSTIDGITFSRRDQGIAPVANHRVMLNCARSRPRRR